MYTIKFSGHKDNKGAAQIMQHRLYKTKDGGHHLQHKLCKSTNQAQNAAPNLVYEVCQTKQGEKNVQHRVCNAIYAAQVMKPKKSSKKS